MYYPALQQKSVLLLCSVARGSRELGTSGWGTLLGAEITGCAKDTDECSLFSTRGDFKGHSGKSVPGRYEHEERVSQGETKGQR